MHARRGRSNAARQHHLVKHVQVLIPYDVAENQIAVVCVALSEKVRDEDFCRSLDPTMSDKVLGLRQSFWQKLTRDGFDGSIQLHDVMPVVFRRATVQQQQHRLQVLFQCMNGEPEEIDIEAIDSAPACGDVVLVRVRTKRSCAK